MTTDAVDVTPAYAENDATLADRLNSSPAALDGAQRRATSLRKEAGRYYPATPTFDAVWNAAVSACHQAVPATSISTGPDRLAAMPSRVNAFQAALYAEAFYSALIEVPALQRQFVVDERGQVGSTPRSREIMGQHPALADFLAKQDARLKHEAEQNAARAEQAMRDAPGNLLAMLRRRGIEITLDKNGNLVAPAGTLIPEHELRGLREFKPQIVAILKAEMEAAKGTAGPLVLA